MKKKFFLLLTFLLSFVMFIRIGEAMTFNENFDYVCKKNGYVTTKDNENGEIYCCPQNFNSQRWFTSNDIAQIGCYSPNKSEEECKAAGGEYTSLQGGYKTCFAKRQEPQLKLTVKSSINNDIFEKTCDISGNKCKVKIDFPNNDPSRNVIGYSKTSDCTNLDYSNAKVTVNILKDEVSTLYACYENIYAKCMYDDNIELYYGKDFVRLYRDNANLSYSSSIIVDIDLNILLKYHKSGEYCPNVLFKGDSFPVSFGVNSGILGKEKYAITKSNACRWYNSEKIGNCHKYEIIDKEIYVQSNRNDNQNEKDSNVKKCKDLFGEETLDFIKNIMNWIKIIVPILLLIYGTLDFTKAVFSGKEDDMKKNRDRFIKRVVSAILVFLVPIFVNILLSFANKAWNWINDDTCISYTDND